MAGSFGGTALGGVAPNTAGFTPQATGYQPSTGSGSNGFATPGGPGNVESGHQVVQGATDAPQTATAQPQALGGIMQQQPAAGAVDSQQSSSGRMPPVNGQPQMGNPMAPPGQPAPPPMNAFGNPGGPPGTGGAPGQPAPGQQPNGAGQGYPSGTPGAPNSGVGPTMGDQQTGKFNTDYITPGQSAVSSIAGGPAYDAQVRDAYYNEQKAMLDPQWQQKQADTENQLANMGLSRGSAAWDREKARLDQSQNAAYSSAQNQAIMAGGAESTRLQNAEIARGNFANAAGQQDFTNKVTSQTAQNAGNTAQQQAAQGWQGFKTSEANAATGANAQVSSAALGANAAVANSQAAQATARENAQLQYNLGTRQQEGTERQQDFDNAMRLERDPYEIQNLQMQGMFPTGNPNFAPVGQGGTATGANQADYAGQINAGNAQGNAGIGQMTGSLGGYLIQNNRPQTNPIGTYYGDA